MRIIFHPHALERMNERDASKAEVRETVRTGESFVAKYGRQGHRKNFSIPGTPTKEYRTKQIEAIGVAERTQFVVITVIIKYF